VCGTGATAVLHQETEDKFNSGVLH
jgi:hypothetical protein